MIYPVTATSSQTPRIPVDSPCTECVDSLNQQVLGSNPRRLTRQKPSNSNESRHRATSGGLCCAPHYPSNYPNYVLERLSTGIYHCRGSPATIERVFASIADTFIWFITSPPPRGGA